LNVITNVSVVSILQIEHAFDQKCQWYIYKNTCHHWRGAGIDDAMFAMTTNVMLIRDSKLHGWEERPSKGCHQTKISRW